MSVQWEKTDLGCKVMRGSLLFFAAHAEEWGRACSCSVSSESLTLWCTDLLQISTVAEKHSVQTSPISHPNATRQLKNETKNKPQTQKTRLSLYQQAYIMSPVFWISNFLLCGFANTWCRTLARNNIPILLFQKCECWKDDSVFCGSEEFSPSKNYWRSFFFLLPYNMNNMEEK